VLRCGPEQEQHWLRVRSVEDDRVPQGAELPLGLTQSFINYQLLLERAKCAFESGSILSAISGGSK
jgi:hypothetical protein